MELVNDVEEFGGSSRQAIWPGDYECVALVKKVQGGLQLGPISVDAGNLLRIDLGAASGLEFGNLGL